MKEEKIQSRKIAKEELSYFLQGDIQSSWTDAEIFLTCREMQKEAAKQGVRLPNLHEVYWWIVEERDKKRYGKSRRKKTTSKTRKKGEGVPNKR
jgi:hypothetical protein